MCLYLSQRSIKGCGGQHCSPLKDLPKVRPEGNMLTCPEGLLSLAGVAAISFELPGHRSAFEWPALSPILPRLRYLWGNGRRLEGRSGWVAAASIQR